MSLKSFHVFFIVLSVLLACGCAVWAFANGASQVFAIGSAVVALALVIYGVLFIRKARKIIT